MSSPSPAGRRVRAARPADDDDDGDAPEPDPPIPSAAALAAIRCPRCRGVVELLQLQSWDPYRMLVMCMAPECGRIHLRTPGDGRRRRSYTVELPIPPLKEVGLRPEPIPSRDEALRAAREILSIPRQPGAAPPWASPPAG